MFDLNVEGVVVSFKYDEEGIEFVCEFLIKDGKLVWLFGGIIL